MEQLTALYIKCTLLPRQVHLPIQQSLQLNHLQLRRTYVKMELQQPFLLLSAVHLPHINGLAIQATAIPVVQALVVPILKHTLHQLLLQAPHTIIVQ